MYQLFYWNSSVDDVTRDSRWLQLPVVQAASGCKKVLMMAGSAPMPGCALCVTFLSFW
jgi:hypothetical protein